MPLVPILHLNYPPSLFSLLLSEGLCQWQQRIPDFSQESGSPRCRPFPELTVDEEDIFSAAGPEEVAGLAAVGAIVCLVEWGKGELPPLHNHPVQVRKFSSVLCPHDRIGPVTPHGKKETRCAACSCRQCDITGWCRLIWTARDLQRVAFGDTLQLQVLALLRDRQRVDDLYLGSIWDTKRHEHSWIRLDKRVLSEEKWRCHI